MSTLGKTAAVVVTAMTLASCNATPTSPTRGASPIGSAFNFDSGGRSVFAESTAGWTESDLAFGNFAAVVARTFYVMANLAGARADNAQVTSFASQMIQENSTALQDLVDMTDEVISGDLTLLPPSQQSNINGLMTQSGSNFDSAYMNTIVALTESAITIFRGMLPGIGAPALRAHFTDRINDMAASLPEARNIQSRVGGF